VRQRLGGAGPVRGLIGHEPHQQVPPWEGWGGGWGGACRPAGRCAGLAEGPRG
jgi:hypothetical protein